MVARCGSFDCSLRPDHASLSPSIRRCDNPDRPPITMRSEALKEHSLVQMGSVERAKMSTWKDYQQQAAEFFRSLGLTATVEKVVTGARGIHNLDVHVEGDFLGISFAWVVECKSWKTNVPKEKVAALTAILQDVGADRGFLLSETGFQSGALRIAEKSNITLTSLADLASTVGDRHITARVANLHLRLHNVLTRLRALKEARYDDEFYPPTMEPITKIAFLDMVIDDALKGRLPTPYTPYGPDQKFAHSLEEMLVVSDRLISEAEAWTPPD